MSLQGFKVGDEVESVGRLWNIYTTITRIEGKKLYGFWVNRKTGRIQSVEGYMNYTDCTLIKPRELQYSPDQQGDTEEDL